MRHIAFALVIALSPLAGPCLADGRAFPPDNCSEQAPFMAFTAIQNSNTYCTDGQAIFQNALPGCQANQNIIFDGANFICQAAVINGQDVLEDALPACATGQIVYKDADGSFKCKDYSYPRNCVSRSAITATKIPCGLRSTAYCLSWEYALSGGMSGGSNLQLQNSSAVLDGNGTPIGWAITAYDSSGPGVCTSNKHTSDGTVATGNPSSFQKDSESMSGAAQVTCCPR